MDIDEDAASTAFDAFYRNAMLNSLQSPPAPEIRMNSPVSVLSASVPVRKDKAPVVVTPCKIGSSAFLPDEVEVAKASGYVCTIS